MYCFLLIPIYLFAVPLFAVHFCLVGSGYSRVVGGTDSSRSVPKPSFKTGVTINALAVTIALVISFVFIVVQSQSGNGERPGGELGAGVGMIIGLCSWAQLVKDRLPTSYGHAIAISIITWTSAVALWYVIDRWLLPVLNALAEQRWYAG